MVLEDDKQNLLSTVSDDIDQISKTPEVGVSYLIVGVSIAILLGAILTFGSIKSKQSTVDSLIVSVENDVTAPLASLAKEQSQIVTIKSQLDSLKTALDSREQFGKLLSTVSSNILKKSYLTSLAVQDEDITMAGSADSYADVSKVVAAYRQVDVVTDVMLSSASLNDETNKIDFSLTVKVDRSKFRIKAQASSASAKTTGKSANI